jgi:hypothetical protein
VTVVRKKKNARKYKEVAYSEFIDVKGAYANTGLASAPETVKWIIVVAKLGKEKTAFRTTCGYSKEKYYHSFSGPLLLTSS